VNVPAYATSGLARRLAALCYDALLLTALLLVLTAILLALRRGTAIAPQTWWFQLVVVVVCLLFYGGFWTHGGQTLGMRAWKIRVVRDDGTALDWGDAVLRFAAAWLAALPAGLGYWWCLFDADKRCWHDRLTHTHVQRVERERPLPRALANPQERDHRHEQQHGTRRPDDDERVEIEDLPAARGHAHDHVVAQADDEPDHQARSRSRGT
jgi:uncharacterized RDD family membrane protein YckC